MCRGHDYIIHAIMKGILQIKTDWVPATARVMQPKFSLSGQSTRINQSMSEVIGLGKTRGASCRELHHRKSDQKMAPADIGAQTLQMEQAITAPVKRPHGFVFNIFKSDCSDKNDAYRFYI